MSLSIDNTYFTNYATSASDVSADKVSGSIQNASTDDEMMDACKEFEAYMVQQMFKNMQEAAKIFSDDEDDDSNDYVDMFSDNYLQTISENMVNSGQGIGLAEQLYNSMVRNSGSTSVTTEQAAASGSSTSDSAAD
ncbi:MAG: rod-binding protein [Eubacterium sp.]|nr:rod-binding protein [Eubacterium sp.]